MICLATAVAGDSGVIPRGAVQSGGWPDPPPGYLFFAQHSIGDSGGCAKDHCGNLDPPDQLANTRCEKSAGAAQCFQAAREACDKDEKCHSFALGSIGSKDPSNVDRFQTFAAGVGNLVPNGDWYTYGRAKPCSSCAAGASRRALHRPLSKDTPIEEMEVSIFLAYRYYFIFAEFNTRVVVCRSRQRL